MFHNKTLNMLLYFLLKVINKPKNRQHDTPLKPFGVIFSDFFSLKLNTIASLMLKNDIMRFLFTMLDQNLVIYSHTS